MSSFVSRAVSIAIGVLIATTPVAFADTLTYHDDTYRTGWNSHETTLTPQNVSRSFKKKFTAHVDGLIFAQPLVALNEHMPKGRARGLAIVGTNNDTLYAFDADTGATIWKTSFAVNGATPVPISFDGCDNVGQEDGILSTPVIDRKTDTLYVVASTLEGTTTKHIHHRLHALSLATGIDKLANADITGTYSGPGGTFVFNADVQFQRPGLLEANGQIYVGFGGQCDDNATKYHGWIFAYAAGSLQQSALANITPIKDNNGDYYGGIWMSGAGLAADSSGNIYLVDGNGTFDGTSSFGDSAVRLPASLSLTGSSFFTPYTVFGDNDGDADFGSGGITLLPDVAGGHHLAVAQGKDGILTLMDRDNMGGYTAGGPDHVLAELSLGGVWSSPGAFSDAAGNDYVLTTGGPMYSVMVSGTTAKVVGKTSVSFPSDNGNGSTPSISSNGTKPGTAIAWIIRHAANIDTDHLELYAFDASNLSKQLFAAPLGKWPQTDLNPTLFPTIAGGRVYVPTANSLVAFGLPSAADAFAGAAGSDVAVVSPPQTFGPHVLHAFVTHVAAATLQVRVRDGRTVTVDITQARALGRIGVLYVNRPVALFGAYDGAHVYHVNAIVSANGMRNGTPWPADR